MISVKSKPQDEDGNIRDQSIQESAQEAQVEATGGLGSIVKELLSVKPSMDVAFDVLKDSSICNYGRLLFDCICACFSSST